MHPLLQRAVAALVAATAVTFAVVDANGLAFFLAQQMKLDVVSAVVEFFTPASAIVFLLTWIAAFTPLMNSRWAALSSGIVIAVVASFVGVVSQVAATTPGFTLFNDQAFISIVEVLLVFAVATAVSVLTLGYWVNTSLRRVLARRRGAPFAIVRAPSSLLAKGLVTHIARKKVDVDRADNQWDAYVEVLQSSGRRIVEVEPRDDLADSAFVADTMIILGDTVVLASPGAPSRVDEVAGAEKVARNLGFAVERIGDPGTLEGGDVIVTGATIFVGHSGRTNAEGIRQLRVIAARRGFTVVAVPVTKALHLTTVAFPLPDGTIVGSPRHVDASVFPRFLPMPDASGSLVAVGPDSVVVSASAPATAELVKSLGYRVTALDVSEFEKLEGGVSCLSIIGR